MGVAWDSGERGRGYTAHVNSFEVSKLRERKESSSAITAINTSQTISRPETARRPYRYYSSEPCGGQQAITAPVDRGLSWQEAER